MLTYTEEMEELKRIAEKKLGKSWDKIMKQADKDTENMRSREDPISKAYKESHKPPRKIFKENMEKLK